MKRIEVPINDITAQWFHKYTRGYKDIPTDKYEIYREAVKAGITYANEVIEEERESPLTVNELLAATVEIRRAAFAENDTMVDVVAAVLKLEKLITSKSNDPKPWQPQPGDKCAFWQEGDEVDPFPCRDFGEYGLFDTDTETHGINLGGFYYDHCALLESLDEIGNPPRYFIQRGRCTVCV